MSDRDFYGDWFRDGATPDPMHAAQKGMKPELPKRFYKEAAVIGEDGRHVVSLDGRVARTPAKNLLAFAAPEMAQAVVAEWNAQGTHIDPFSMPVTRIANSAIDGVRPARQAVIEEIAKYGGSDFLCYRADQPEELVRRQNEAWDPVLAWAAEYLGAELDVTHGILHKQQSPEALAAIAKAVSGHDELGLAALHVVTTLTGSVILALAVAQGHLEPEAAWAAAHVDEDYQAELWGQDEEAQQRRAWRWREMEAASRLLALGR
ncbi:ATP12 family chaperone protein [Labrys sp. ZIDIC5]|uniref:ATP12 family chaperone protein n=1 Tax=Labrys sedimenti TaxID=3106036 RepID=UPI002ACAD9C5|nr:ATP12 family protein [Labrys sp. ZIDIC5]MDZ5448094.1 ATP12 family protein [Labrys sp. ZIDIC5]